MNVAARSGRALRGLVRLACARPLLTVLVSLLMAAAGVGYTLRELTFLTSGRDLLPAGERSVLRYTEYLRDFGDLDDITVVVEARNLATAKAYATRLFNELKKSPDMFRRVTYRVDPKHLTGRALLYLPKDKLAEIRDKIFDYQELMEQFAARPTLDQLIEGINTRVASGFVSHLFDLGLDDAKDDTDLRFLRDFIAQISARLDRPVPYRSPWGALFRVEGAEDDAGYFLSDDQRLLFVTIDVAETTGTFTNERAAIEALRTTIAGLRSEFPEVRVGVTGAPALSNDEMTAAFRDSQIATVLAFALTLALLLLAFLRVGKPLLMLLTLAVSLCWSLGVITLAVGHLSLFSVIFISIVIGIGIDYGIYFLFRYEEEVFLGRTLQEALTLTAARSGPGILMGALTAAGTFYVLMATDFRGIQELGFIAGTSILLAWLAMMTLFPALIVLADCRRAAPSPVPRAIQLERIHVPFIERVTAHPKTVLIGAAIATALSLVALGTVRFDYNLLNLQAAGTESVIWEKRILTTAGRSGFTALATAGTLPELRKKEDAFRALPSVAEVDSVLLLIPSEQQEKQRIIRDFAPVVAPVRVGMAEPVDLERLQTALDTLKRRFDIAAGEAAPGPQRDELVAVQGLIGELVWKLGRRDQEVAEAALTHLQHQLYQDFVTNFHNLQRNLRPRQVQLADVPNDLRRKFIGESGRFLLQIHPAVDIWDRMGAERFVRDLRRIDPDVTGTPVITYQAIRLMEKGYQQGTLYAFILVALLTAVICRRLRETALGLLPLLLGTLWTVGLMWMFRLPFNLGNVFGLPLLIGAGAEFGLNVVLRYREGLDHGGPLVARSTVMAVLVNGLTTMVGFGSLMIADHRGIFGLGLLLTLGMAASLTASLVVLPVMLRWLQPKPRHPLPAGAPAPESTENLADRR
jgi:uncharacterized protein